jgi:hypothetical protein
MNGGHTCHFHANADLILLPLFSVDLLEATSLVKIKDAQGNTYVFVPLLYILFMYLCNPTFFNINYTMF